eukprot:2514704-Pyramimonas_sp.AAC.1
MDPDMHEAKMQWMSEQSYRVAIELTKDFKRTEIDGATADEDAARTHLEKVEQCRTGLLREVNLLRAH